MRRVVSQTSPAPKTTWFSWTPIRSSAASCAIRESSVSARAGTIASSSAPAASSSSVSLTDIRYESVAAMTSFAPSKRTSTPVSTGRDSSRDAERATFETVSRNAALSTVKVCAPSTSGQLREVLRAVRVQLVRGRPAGDLEHSLLGPVLENHLAVRQQARQVDQQPPGRDDRAVALDLCLDRRAAARAPCRSRRARAGPSPPRRSTPPSTWTAARVETALPTTESARVSSSFEQVTFTADPTAVSISVI